MPDSPQPSNESTSAHTRRELLRWGAGVGVLGTAGCETRSDADTTPSPSSTGATTSATTTTPTPTTTEATGYDITYTDFANDVDGWAWFPADDSLWGRSDDPFDVRVDGSRWVAVPSEDGDVRCRVEDDDPPGNAGVYFDIGRVGAFERIEIDTETRRSDSGDQRLLVALYLDISGDGDYFQWEESDDHESFVSLGDDAELLGFFQAGDSVVIDEETVLDRIPPTEETPVSIGEVQRETVPGVSSNTEAALQVSVVGSGPNTVEEMVVHGLDVTARRTAALNWPMPGHDYTNTSVNRDSVGPASAVHPRWTFETGGPVRSSPAVVDGTVYVGSNDGFLYALDATSGEQVWAYETGGPVVSSPAVLARTVYVGSDDGHINAVSTHTGNPRWTVETDDRVRGSPAVQAYSDVTGADQFVAVGNDAGTMYALDAITGEPIETIQSGGRVVAAPVIYYVGRDSNEYFRGVWEMAWMDTNGIEYEWVPSDPVGDGKVLYVWDIGSPSHASMSCPHMNADSQAPTLHRYTCTDDGRLIKIATGREHLWTFEADSALRASPVVGSEIVVLPSVSGSVYGIAPSSGEVRWTFETGGRVDASPSMADGVVYVCSHDGRVRALAADSGEDLWSFDTGSPVRTAPAVVDGTAYVGSDDGTVYALGEQ